MNKLSIVTAITFASIAFVSAEGSTTNKRPVQVKPQAIRQEVMSNIRTNDPALGAQIKALNTEMEAKIKAIREEYALRLKALIANHATSTNATSTATTTRNFREDMPGQRNGMDEGRKMGIPFIDASSTATGTLPRMEDGQNQSNASTSKFINFLRGLFGGNR